MTTHSPARHLQDGGGTLVTILAQVPCFSAPHRVQGIVVGQEWLRVFVRGGKDLSELLGQDCSGWELLLTDGHWESGTHTVRGSTQPRSGVDRFWCVWFELLLLHAALLGIT